MAYVQKLTRSDLLQRQSLPLEAKIVMAQNRIRQWYDHWNGQVSVSFSGGKDSTVLLDLVWDLYPDVPAVFVDTGLEYPEVRQFVRTYENVIILRPEMSFKEVITSYGYPVVGKEVARTIRYAQQGSAWALRKLAGLNPDGSVSRWNSSHYHQWAHLVHAPFKVSDICCEIMKKKPLAQYQRESERLPFLGTMACESVRRQSAYLQAGCNAYEGSHKRSTPLAVWTEQDVLQYILDRKLRIPTVYGDIVRDEKGQLRTTGAQRTGCMFCAFGAQCEKSPNRFEKLKETHPKQYDFCMRDENGLGLGAVLDYMKIKH